VPDEAAWASADLVLGNYPVSARGGPNDAETVSGELVLRPWEARVYRRSAWGDSEGASQAHSH
jgi:hypothetical protein